MKKMKLNLSELQVESFETSALNKRRGTVAGNFTGDESEPCGPCEGTNDATCYQQFSCGATNCGENTCEGNSCDGTCDAFCSKDCNPGGSDGPPSCLLYNTMCV